MIEFECIWCRSVTCNLCKRWDTLVDNCLAVTFRQHLLRLHHGTLLQHAAIIALAVESKDALSRQWRGQARDAKVFRIDQNRREFNDIIEPTTLSSMNWYMSGIFASSVGWVLSIRQRLLSSHLLILKPQSLGSEISRSVLDRVHSQSKNCRQCFPPIVQQISQTCYTQSV